MKAYAKILVAGGVLYAAGTAALFKIGFGSDRKLPAAAKKGMSDLFTQYDAIIREGSAWYKSQSPQNAEIRSFDGLRLRATYLPAENSRGLIIAFHGYRSTPLRDMGPSVRYYHELGFSLLLPAQRACADSEGKYISFGVNERRDVRDWVAFAAKAYPEAENIILAGISLGSSSVLMSLGEGTHENVRAVVADCGYSTVFDELSYVVKNFCGVKLDFLVKTVARWARLIGGFDIAEGDAKIALRQNKLPILFIHGEADELVPVTASYENYEAAACEKELFTVPGASHALSYLIDMPGYHRVVEDFLSKHCPRRESQ